MLGKLFVFVWGAGVDNENRSSFTDCCLEKKLVLPATFSFDVAVSIDTSGGDEEVFFC